MATKKPRITVNLDPEVHGILQRLSALTGHSMSFLIADLMKGVSPQLLRTIEVIEAAKNALPDMQQKLAEQYKESEQKILEAQSIVEDQFDLFEAMAMKK